MLLGFRSSTVDIDVKLIPDSDELLWAIPKLKEELRVNVELAAPDQFIPPLPATNTPAQSKTGTFESINQAAQRP